jgi:hypothetical protein
MGTGSALFFDAPSKCQNNSDTWTERRGPSRSASQVLALRFLYETWSLSAPSIPRLSSTCGGSTKPVAEPRPAMTAAPSATPKRRPSCQPSGNSERRNIASRAARVMYRPPSTCSSVAPPSSGPFDSWIPRFVDTNRVRSAVLTQTLWLGISSTSLPRPPHGPLT